jgi:exopolysaccharide production protein ExoZ
MRRTVHSIQFLRFVAAALVVFFHSSVALKISHPGAVSERFDYLASFGAAGVHIFFVISGFVMFYTSFAKPNSGFSATTFLLRRAIRIYPIYILYAVCFLFLYHALGSGYQLTLTQIIGGLLLIPGYAGLVIGPGWTLSYEVYFYVTFALMMTLSPIRGLLALTLLFAISIIIGIFFQTDQPIVRVVTNPLLLEFILGAWIAHCLLAGPKVPPLIANTMIAAGLGGFAIGLMFGYSRVPSAAAWGVPSSLLVGGLVFRECGDRRLAFIEKLSFLGDSSYSLYLLHVMLIDGILYAISLLSSVVRFEPVLICLALTLQCGVAAVVCYELIERPMLSSLQALISRRRLKERTSS